MSVLYFRHCIAALHYNENVKEEHAVTKDSRAKWDAFFLKVKKGGFSIRPVGKDSAYGRF